MKKILFAASECEPFIKTGGLGNVVGSLPRYLDAKQYDVRVVIPDYECISETWKEKMETVIHFPVYFGEERKVVGLKQITHEGITCYFLNQPDLFGGPSPYADLWADTGKFIFFSKAVLELLSYIDFEPDVIHCHDWQVGLIPAMLRTTYSQDPFLSRIKTVVTIHNLRFQGLADIDYVRYLTGMPDEAYAYDKIEYYGKANMLKGGMSYADMITTVSETYAEEIQTEEYGEGLEGLLQYRSDCLMGIVNGIDYQVYSPTKDVYLEDHYNAGTFVKGKAKNKAALQKMVGLPQDPDAMVFGIISRLTDQKGFDLIGLIFERIIYENIQLIVLGGGDPKIEGMFRYFANIHPHKVVFEPNYNDKLAKYIYAGSDASLMPSRFEPCGLSQLMAFRYGSVPIIRQTGGLKDTVALYDAEEKTGTGFGFAEYDALKLLDAIRASYKLFTEDKEEWNALVKRGMQLDFSWKSSAKKYQKMYQQLTK